MCMFLLHRQQPKPQDSPPLYYSACLSQVAPLGRPFQSKRTSTTLLLSLKMMSILRSIRLFSGAAKDRAPSNSNDVSTATTTRHFRSTGLRQPSLVAFSSALAPANVRTASKTGLKRSSTSMKVTPTTSTPATRAGRIVRSSPSVSWSAMGPSHFRMVSLLRPKADFSTATHGSFDLRGSACETT